MTYLFTRNAPLVLLDKRFLVAVPCPWRLVVKTLPIHLKKDSFLSIGVYFRSPVASPNNKNQMLKNEESAFIAGNIVLSRMQTLRSI